MLTLPMVVALSANHLAALELPNTIRRLYLVRDDDPAGRAAVDTLGSRAGQAGVEVLVLDAMLGDLNDDLRLLAPRLHKRPGSPANDYLQAREPIRGLASKRDGRHTPT